MVVGIFRSLTPSGSVACAGLRLLASQNQPFPSLTLVPSAFAVEAQITLSLSLLFAPPPSCLGWNSPEWRMLFLRCLVCQEAGEWFEHCLVNGSFETNDAVLESTMLSSFDVYTIWLYYPLPSLSLVCVDFQVTLKYSLRIQISGATAAWALSRRTSTFLVNFSLKPPDLLTHRRMTSSIPVSHLPSRTLLWWRMAPITRASVIAIYLTTRPMTPSHHPLYSFLYNFIPLV